MTPKPDMPYVRRLIWNGSQDVMDEILKAWGETVYSIQDIEQPFDFVKFIFDNAESRSYIDRSIFSSFRDWHMLVTPGVGPGVLEYIDSSVVTPIVEVLTQQSRDTSLFTCRNAYIITVTIDEGYYTAGGITYKFNKGLFFAEFTEDGKLSFEELNILHHRRHEWNIVGEGSEQGIVWNIPNKIYPGFAFRDQMTFMPNLEATLVGLGIPSALLDITRPGVRSQELLVEVDKELRDDYLAQLDG